MHRPVFVVLATLTVVGLVYSATIPPGTKGCKRDDPKLNECIVKTTNELIPVFINGDEEYGFPVLDPFKIEKIALNEKKGQAFEIALNLEDLNVKGLKDAVIEDGTMIDIQNQKVEIKVAIPTMVIDAKYTVDGKVLLLPIKGAGDGNLTLSGLKVTFDSDYSLHKGKDGKDFGQVSNSRVYFTVDNFNIYLDNLFNGDKNLGDHMNVFLNENWQELVKEFGPVIRETLRTIIFTIVNNIAVNVPYEVYLPE